MHFLCRPRLTREHVWADWLRKLNPPALAFTVESKWYAEMISTRTAPEPELVVKWVCRDCNNGWMAALEDEAGPILTKMIRGDPKVTLWRDHQAVLSAWAVKTAMVFEFTNPNHPQYFTGGERRAMLEERSIPAKTSVVLFAHAEGIRTRVAAGDYEASGLESGGSYRLHLTTLLLRRLVV